MASADQEMRKLTDDLESSIRDVGVSFDHQGPETFNYDHAVAQAEPAPNPPPLILRDAPKPAKKPRAAKPKADAVEAAAAPKRAAPKKAAAKAPAPKASAPTTVASRTPRSKKTAGAGS
jgi:hypothetical protein